jgi:hypothetical protein
VETVLPGILLAVLFGLVALVQPTTQLIVVLLLEETVHHLAAPVLLVQVGDATDSLEEAVLLLAVHQIDATPLGATALMLLPAQLLTQHFAQGGTHLLAVVFLVATAEPLTLLNVFSLLEETVRLGTLEMLLLGTVFLVHSLYRETAQPGTRLSVFPIPSQLA